jgi:hypothetical protein
MPVTFYNKAEAMEYARQKQAEGFAIDICGGEKGDYKYVVTLHRKVKRPKKGSAFSPYITREEVYSPETNNSMLKRLEASSAKRLCTKADIIKRAKVMFKRHGFTKIDIKIEKINDRDGMSDAQVSSDGGKVTLRIHPIHQYTTTGNLNGTLQHEINHLKEG